MKRVLLAVVLSLPAWGEPGPSTRPVMPPEVDEVVAGESAPVELVQDNYKLKLSWYPAAPAPGDLVRYRWEVVVPGGGEPSVVMKVSVKRTGPGGESVLLPTIKVEPDSMLAPGKFSFQQVYYTDGLYRVEFQVDDLAMGKTVTMAHAVSMGQPQSNLVVYAILIGAVALCALVLAFGRKKTAE